MSEDVLASAVRFLIDGGDEEAARLLLMCELQLDCPFFNDPRADAVISGPRAA
jgi:hypothetical protein